MNLPPTTGTAYLRYAFAQMLQLVDVLGDPLLDERPTRSDTNAVGALVLHC